MDVLAHRLCSLASPDLEDARSSVMAKNRPTLTRGGGGGGCARAVSGLREGLQKEEEDVGSDPYAHTFHCDDGFASAYLCQLIKLYMLNTCSLLYVNYTSIKLSTKSKAPNSKTISHIHYTFVAVDIFSS